MNDDARLRHYRLLLRRGVPVRHARRLATGYLIGIGLATNTTFVANWGDGFDDLPNPGRDQAQRVARRAGVNPTGKTYCPGLAAPGVSNDPKAWVPHDDAKGYVAKRCRELNYACPEFGIKSREPETDSEQPYRTAPELVNREVDRLVERDHGGKLQPAKRAELFEATQERLSGNPD